MKITELDVKAKVDSAFGHQCKVVNTFVSFCSFKMKSFIALLFVMSCAFATMPATWDGVLDSSGKYIPGN